MAIYNAVSGGAMGLVVLILAWVGAPIRMTCSAVCVLLRCVPSPGKPSIGGNASDISIVYASQLLVLRVQLFQRASSV